MKATGIGIAIKENGKIIGRMTAKEFMAHMNRPNKFLADLIAEFNKQDRGVTAESYIITK